MQSWLEKGCDKINPPAHSLVLEEVRVVLKYRHCDGNLCIKVTDDVVCLLYRTDQAQDVKKIEKFHSQLMRLMVAKESRSAAMETD
ncbi:signal recognition particle 9 kDa protein isoform X3 [Alligator sinensis]|uniref:Signal recognition particle 9 kDa protein n=1 Tax=Alligator sinensis TaxID=38654 RepID=A0A3Q0HNC2_ALLSI|nr:signal recognition particle 9 kDa protein isoform X3 [Alligator sinensis]